MAPELVAVRIGGRNWREGATSNARAIVRRRTEMYVARSFPRRLWLRGAAACKVLTGLRRKCGTAARQQATQAEPARRSTCCSGLRCVRSRLKTGTGNRCAASPLRGHAFFGPLPSPAEAHEWRRHAGRTMSRHERQSFDRRSAAWAQARSSRRGSAFAVRRAIPQRRPLHGPSASVTIGALAHGEAQIPSHDEVGAQRRPPDRASVFLRASRRFPPRRIARFRNPHKDEFLFAQPCLPSGSIARAEQRRSGICLLQWRSV